ncbi:MAG TPA: cupin domain-containing protein [Candidatus Omnitrophota bacterium]|nr:cupin domain-containing protein [Candidatus Omnitrophota bacterium]
MNKRKPISVRIEGNDKYQRILGGAPATCGMRSGHVVLKPGESVGEHNTDEREEAIIILRGHGQLFCEGSEAIDIEKDMVLYVPPLTKHDVKNSGVVDLEYVYVVVPIAVK